MTQRDPSVGYDIVPRKRNTYPRKNEEFLDLPKLIADFILGTGSPMRFGAGARIFLQGSCFAENLYKELKEVNRPCYYNAMVEGLNSPLANLIYLKNLDPGSDVFRELSRADVFVLTIGVAPSWYEKATGSFVMQPDMRHVERYVHRTVPVKDQSENLRQMLDALYRINPALNIVLTLSPVPLSRSFEFESAIVADCVSKSTLRVALHETIAAYPGKKPFYFPSFEIVRWAGGHVGDAFGEDGLPRHISGKYVKQIIASFLAASGSA